MSEGYQTSAIDPDQQAYAARRVKARVAREAELWRWLLTQKMGREFLWDVLLVDVRYERPVLTDAHVALHNLGVIWMQEQIRRHRELYLQMLSEASKRDDDERREDETARATWARGEHDEDAP